MAQNVSVVVTVSPAGQEEQQVADDLHTALLGLATDAPYDVTGVALAPAAEDAAEDASTTSALTPYDVRQATETEPAAGLTAEGAYQNYTPAGVAAAEGAPTPRAALRSLEDRLVAFLGEQHDVLGIQEVGDGIYGFALVGTPNGVSLTISLTQ